MSDNDITAVETVLDNGKFGTRTVKFETGLLARQAAVGFSTAGLAAELVAGPDLPARLKGELPHLVWVHADVGGRELIGLLTLLQSSDHTASLPVVVVSADAREAPSADLQAFYDQEIDWSSCEGDHECATLTVPVDYADPEGDTIDLALLRVPAADRAQGSLVVNPGGPGAPGTDYAAAAGQVLRVPLPPTVPDEHRTARGELFTTRAFPVLLVLMLCAGAAELTISQWSSLFAEQALGLPKVGGDLAGPLLFAALMLGFPFFAIQMWRFVAPGLYAKEKKALLPFLLMTPLFFGAGASFAYFVAMPWALSFLLGYQGEVGGIRQEALPAVGNYLSFVTRFLFGFGVAFLMPVLLMVLERAGIVTREQLAGSRRYALVGAAGVSAVLTPPDAISMLMMLVPLYGLYELALLTIRLTHWRAARRAPPAEAMSGVVDAAGEARK